MFKRGSEESACACAMGSKEETGGAGEASLDGLPSALVATVMTKLDIASICSLASTSSALRSCARHILSFLPSFNLLVPLFLSLLTFFFLIFSEISQTHSPFCSRTLLPPATFSDPCCRPIPTSPLSSSIVPASMTPPSPSSSNPPSTTSPSTIAPISVADSCPRSAPAARI